MVGLRISEHVVFEKLLIGDHVLLFEWDLVSLYKPLQVYQGVNWDKTSLYVSQLLLLFFLLLGCQESKVELRVQLYWCDFRCRPSIDLFLHLGHTYLHFFVLIFMDLIDEIKCDD